MRIVVWKAFIELCRSNVEVLLGAFCVAGRTFYLRPISGHLYGSSREFPYVEMPGKSGGTRNVQGKKQRRVQSST